MNTSISKVISTNQFLLDGVAFYGRTYEEYAEMFNFQAEDWYGKHVLDCASGPASFTAEAHKEGIFAVACDPMYTENSNALISRAEKDLQQCLSKSEGQRPLFDPYSCERNSHYVAEKERAIFSFSRDYTLGKREKRYVAGSLPSLPLKDNSFDLVLCAHLLFVYADKKDGGVFEQEKFPFEFHLDAIREMIRVSKNEVRIYPLKGPNRPDNPLLDRVLKALAKEDNIKFELEHVDYKDIAGANMMLRITKILA